MLSFFKDKVFLVTKKEFNQRKERARALFSLLDQVITTTHDQHSILEDRKICTLLYTVRSDIIDRIFSKKIWYLNEYETLYTLLQKLVCCYGTEFDYYRDLLYYKYEMGPNPNLSTIDPKDRGITAVSSDTPIGRIYLNLRNNQSV